MKSDASDGIEISDRRTLLLRIVGVGYLVLVSASLFSSLRNWGNDTDVSSAFLFSILFGALFVWFAIKGATAKRVWLMEEHLRIWGWRSEFLVPLRHLSRVSYAFPGYITVKARSEVGEEVSFSFLAQQHWLPFRYLWSHPTAENLRELADGKQGDDLNWEAAGRSGVLSTRGFIYLLAGGLLFWGVFMFGITQALYGGADYRAVVVELTTDPYIREKLEGAGLWPFEPALGASLNSKGGYYEFRRSEIELTADQIIERATSTEQIWSGISDTSGAAGSDRKFSVYFNKDGNGRTQIYQIIDSRPEVVFDRRARRSDASRTGNTTNGFWPPRRGTQGRQKSPNGRKPLLETLQSARPSQGLSFVYGRHAEVPQGSMGSPPGRSSAGRSSTNL